MPPCPRGETVLNPLCEPALLEPCVIASLWQVEHPVVGDTLLEPIHTIPLYFTCGEEGSRIYFFISCSVEFL